MVEVLIFSSIAISAKGKDEFPLDLVTFSYIFQTLPCFDARERHNLQYKFKKLILKKTFI